MAGDLSFRDIARSAGENVKEALQEGLKPVSKTKAHEAYDICSFNTEPSDDQSSILKNVKDAFEIEIFKQRHPKGRVEWRRVFLISQTIPDDAAADSEPVASNRREDLWLLALYAEGKDEGKIGRSFSLHTRFKVEKGDIFLGYEVV